MTGCGKSLRGDAAALFFAVCQLPVLPPALSLRQDFACHQGKFLFALPGKKGILKIKPERI